MVLANWEEEVASALLEMLVDDFVKIRGSLHCICLVGEVQERAEEVHSESVRKVNL